MKYLNNYQQFSLWIVSFSHSVYLPSLAFSSMHFLFVVLSAFLVINACLQKSDIISKTFEWLSVTWHIQIQLLSSSIVLSNSQINLICFWFLFFINFYPSRIFLEIVRGYLLSSFVAEVERLLLNRNPLKL